MINTTILWTIAIALLSPSVLFLEVGESGESGKKEDKYEHCYQLSAKCSSQDKQRWENNETKVERWTNVEVVVVGLALTTILQTFTFLWNLDDLCENFDGKKTS